MKRIGLFLVFVGFFSASLFAGGTAVWSLVSATKKINKNWNAYVEAELRSHPNFTGGMGYFSFAVGTNYNICQYLSATATYVLIDRNTNGKYTSDSYITDYWGLSHRFHFSLTGKVKFGDFSVSLRERWQYTYRPERYVAQLEKDMLTLREAALVKGNAKHLLRSRLQLGYGIRSINLSPYVSAELFSSDKLDYVWYTVGAEYKINPQHVLDLYYRYQDKSSLNIIGVGYKYKF